MQQKPYTNISFVYDREQSEFVFMDEAFALFSKKERGQITPELLMSLVHPHDREYINEKFQVLLAGTLDSSVEFRIILETEIHWVRLTPFLFNAEGKSLIAAIVADITAEWNNFDTIRKYANKKNSILNMLAHDLRGPLDVAHSLAKTVDRKTYDPALLKMTSSITGILNQSIRLITDMLDREMLDTVEVELSLQRIDVVLKLSEYVEECKKSEPAAEREFRFSSSKDSIYIEVDESKFMQIMNNLITNALKFTHPGGVISVDVTDKKDSVLFTVSDTGIGIPKDLHSNLFDKFTKARRKGLNGEPTMGLGLSIVKMIVEWHKGKVWVNSEEDEGSTFFIQIPKNSAGK